MSQRYISQLDMSTDMQETNVIENDLLSGSQAIKVTAYRAETPLSVLATGMETMELHIGEREKIGQGTFGYRRESHSSNSRYSLPLHRKVYRAKLISTQEVTAIKEVEIEEKFKSRELDILKTIIHPNIVRLKYFFHTSSTKDILYLIMEYMPMSAHQLISDYRRNHKILPLFYIKLFSYQMLRGLGYLHVQGVVSRYLLGEIAE